MMHQKKKSKVSDCVKFHFNVLAIIGFYRPIVIYESRVLRIIHKIWRNIMLFLVVAYNIQHIVFIVQVKKYKYFIKNCLDLITRKYQTQVTH